VLRGGIAAKMVALMQKVRPLTGQICIKLLKKREALNTGNGVKRAT